MESSIHPVLDPEQIHAIETLKGAQRVLLTGHERPDGDCIGAQAAISRVLEALGKQVAILNPDPPELRFGVLSRAVDFGVDQGGPIPPHDLLILLDCSELSRTGALSKRFEEAGSKKMVIDHHIKPLDRWWDASFHDVTASSTGLLGARVANELGVPLDDIAARGIFASLVTDTGWFKYSNTDAETLALAASLVGLGIDVSKQYMDLFQRRPETHPNELGKLLTSTEFHADGRLALLTLPLNPQGKVHELDTDDALDVVRSVGTIEVVVFVREVRPGLCKLSARSKTTYDVAALASTFGGGGHRKAAGATIKGSLKEASQRVLRAALGNLED